MKPLNAISNLSARLRLLLLLNSRNFTPYFTLHLLPTLIDCLIPTDTITNYIDVTSMPRVVAWIIPNGFRAMDFRLINK